MIRPTLGTHCIRAGFMPWTMKLSKGDVIKSVVWLPNSSRDDFSLHQGKNSIGTREVEVPNIQFESITNALAKFDGFFGERGKRGGLLAKGNGPRQRNAVLIYIYIYLLGVVHDVAVALHKMVTS